MTEYSNSQKTKSALINAAGELFVEYGVKAVTTRAIAKKAGENIGNIHYHFGGKEGLLEAVADFAVKDWEGDPLGTFLEDNKKMLKTPEGQITLIMQMIILFFSIFFSKDRPSWCGSFIFQLLQRDSKTRDKIMEQAAIPNTKAFINLYKKITMDSDPERSHCWAVSMMAPLVLYSINPYPIEALRKTKDKDFFIKKLRERTISNALASLDLYMVSEKPGN
jgi:AcrR family transcriptional regulator